MIKIQVTTTTTTNGINNKGVDTEIFIKDEDYARIASIELHNGYIQTIECYTRLARYSTEEIDEIYRTVLNHLCDDEIKLETLSNAWTTIIKAEDVLLRF